ncbi:MAG: PAS domain-containing protein, partial [Chloroflexi bacterium]|nr:PAS domain-containing protein [Chloroflexota bacterium]
MSSAPKPLTTLMLSSTSLFGALDFLSAVGCLVVAAMAWRRRPAPGVGTFMFLTASIAWWCLWPAAQALNPTALSDYTLTRLAWLGVALAPTAYLLFGLEYLNTGLRLRLAMVLLLALEPGIIIAAVVLNDKLQLLWITSATSHAAGIAITGHGPLWSVHLVYSYALQAVTSLRFGRFLFGRSGRLYRRQTVLLLIALTVPWAANILVVAGRSPFATDITAPTLAVSAIAFGVAMFSQRLLDVMPLAQAEVFRSITDGILVLDREQRVLDLNPAAAQLAQGSALQAIGRPLTAVMPDLASQLTGGASNEIEIEREPERTARVLRVRRSELRDRAGRTCGDIVLLTDVTEERRVGELERSRQLMLGAQEALRQEIAEQLHSSVQTRLLLAELQLTRAMDQLRTDFSGGMQLLADLEDKLDHIRERDVRQLSHRLHPSVIAIGLGPALETLVAGQ